jgi:hypothetical protein
MTGKAKTAEKKPKTKGDSKEHRVEVALTADTNRLVPLAEGRFVWYFDPINSKCLHLNTRKEEFADALRPACDLGLSPRIIKELEALHARWPDHGWNITLEALIDAGVVA